MVQTNLQIPEAIDGLLSTIATKQGKKKEDLILQVIEQYIGHTPSGVDILEKRKKAFGVWKDRTDLPDFDEIRRSMDRKLNWDD